MPNIRVMLWVALAAILFLNYEAWMRDYPVSAPEATEAASGRAAGSSTLGDSLPQAGVTGTPAAGTPAAGTRQAPKL
jgi:YidC/Oxa1 family membrane protein insertase